VNTFGAIYLQNVVTHEIGHALGYMGDKTTDPNDLMKCYETTRSLLSDTHIMPVSEKNRQQITQFRTAYNKGYLG